MKITSEGLLKKIFIIILLLFSFCQWQYQIFFQYYDIKLSNYSLSQRLDFSHYFLTSKRVVNNSKELYLNKFDQEELNSFNFEIDKVVRPTNPPLLALVLAPMGLFNPKISWLFFNILTAILSILSLSYFLRKLNFNKVELLVGLVMFMISSPMISNFRFSQISSIIICLIIFLCTLLDKYPKLAGIILGFITAIKFFTFPIFFFLLSARKFVTLSIACLCFAFFQILPLIIDKRLNLFDYYQYGFYDVREWAYFSFYNQSISGIINTILKYLLGKDQEEYIRLVFKYATIVVTLIGVILQLLVGRFYNSKTNYLSFCISSMLCILFSPLAWPHYYLLIWPLIFVLWQYSKSKYKFLYIILWFNFPLMPITVNSLVPNEREISSYFLTFMPASIFIITLFYLIYLQLKNEDNTNPKIRNFIF